MGRAAVGGGNRGGGVYAIALYRVELTVRVMLGAAATALVGALGAGEKMNERRERNTLNHFSCEK